MAELGGDVMVVRWLTPILDLAGLPGRTLALDRGPSGWAHAVRTLRREAYDVGVLLSPSFSSAWLFRWGGVRELRGTDSDGRGWLLRERVPREELAGRHRFDQYRAIAGCTGSVAREPGRLELTPEHLAPWRERVDSGRPIVGVFPGSHAPARRWPADRFSELCARLDREGMTPVILGAESEAALTAAVAGRTAGAKDFGGRTTLADLAALLAVCDVLVTNDSGPMHLAAAVGTPTVALWGPSDPAEAEPLGAETVGVSGPALPCRPCHKNRCSRSGRGTILDDAHEECMRLIETDAVMNAVRRMLGREATP